MRQIMINLDYQSRTPIYEQIVNGIEKYVALGILKEKTQIPSIREMASNLGINPNTVKKSYDILEGRGVITTISTKGTFISEDTKKAMKQVLTDIQDGTFAKDFLLDMSDAGSQVHFKAMRKLAAEHQSEVVGKEIRSLYSWSNEDKLINN